MMNGRRILQNLALASILGTSLVASAVEVTEVAEDPKAILKVEARRHSGIAKKWMDIYKSTNPVAENDLFPHEYNDHHWKLFKTALFGSTAFLSAYYSESQVSEVWYFIRDPMVVAYAWQLMEPNSSRHKTLAISRMSRGDSHLPEYLRSVNFTESHFKELNQAGKKSLLFDSGYAMSLGFQLTKNFSPEAKSATQFQLNTAIGVEVPETLLLGALAEELPTRAVDYMAYVPKNSGRVKKYVEDNEGWKAVALKGNEKIFEVTSIISQEAVRIMMEDLKATFYEGPTQKLISDIKTVVKGLNSYAQTNNRAGVVRVLSNLASGSLLSSWRAKDRQALIEDWLRAHTLNPVNPSVIFEIRPEEIGLQRSYYYSRRGRLLLDVEIERKLHEDVTLPLRSGQFNRIQNFINNSKYAGNKDETRPYILGKIDDFLSRFKVTRHIPAELITILQNIAADPEWRPIIDKNFTVARILTELSTQNQCSTLTAADGLALPQ